jgi:hypothetical protein
LRFFAKAVLSEAEGLRMTFTRRVTENSVKTVEAIKADWKWGTWEGK